MNQKEEKKENKHMRLTKIHLTVNYNKYIYNREEFRKKKVSKKILTIWHPP